MNLTNFIQRVKQKPEQVEFNDTMAVIEANYDITACAFDNGGLHNAADQNQGSCKLLAFAQLNGLDQQQTLACFGHFYRDEVLGDPQGDGHQNIRHFMQHGWSGVQFDGEPLKAKESV